MDARSMDCFPREFLGGNDGFSHTFSTVSPAIGDGDLHPEAGKNHPSKHASPPVSPARCAYFVTEPCIVPSLHRFSPQPNCIYQLGSFCDRRTMGHRCEALRWMLFFVRSSGEAISPSSRVRE
ncbi:homoserine O-acetyltransferase [Aspergillus luchuensis]|uniref:Homoserine O-acetyltransferase n=1 Tax=Aspergillus kawachii TaxID=1069201 RepID=A0A146FJN6_ASPKA|nr:homoserine O-acetyltransferase [Aspergillus luchuensis]